MTAQMYKVVALTCFIFIFLTMQAQIGLRVEYDRVSHDDWSNELASLFNGVDKSFNVNRSVGIDYWFRSKKYRIEFMPSIYYSKSNTVGISSVGTYDSFQYKQYYSRMNTHVYFLDFVADCDCPTWSNDNDFLKKSIFFHIGPEFGLRNHNRDGLMPNTAFYWGISTGLGLDIGFSNLITVSPLFRLGYRSETTWKNFVGESASVSDNTTYYGAELRLGIRFDWK